MAAMSLKTEFLSTLGYLINRETHQNLTGLDGKLLFVSFRRRGRRSLPEKFLQPLHGRH
jgi:hypothetical protein